MSTESRNKRYIIETLRLAQTMVGLLTIERDTLRHALATVMSRPKSHVYACMCAECEDFRTIAHREQLNADPRKTDARGE